VIDINNILKEEFCVLANGITNEKTINKGIAIIRVYFIEFVVSAAGSNNAKYKIRMIINITE
jgi:hypothetical protein